MMKAKEAVKDRKNDVKGEEKGKKPKRFARMKKGLIAGLMIATAAGLAAGCGEEYASISDGGTSDASALDANVTSDASLLDGSVTPDASLLDGSVTVDANISDGSITPDGSVSDGSVNDAATQQDGTVGTCVATAAPKLWHFVGANDTVSAGGYDITVVSVSLDPKEVTVDVVCPADSSMVATGVVVQQGQSTVIPLGSGMDLTMYLQNTIDFGGSILAILSTEVN